MLWAPVGDEPWALVGEEPLVPVGEKPWAPVGEEPWAPVGRSRPAALLEVEWGTKGRRLDWNEGRFMVVHRFRCARGVRFEGEYGGESGGERILELEFAPYERLEAPSHGISKRRSTSYSGRGDRRFLLGRRASDVSPPSDGSKIFFAKNTLAPSVETVH
jgi:hypothetical protein